VADLGSVGSRASTDGARGGGAAVAAQILAKGSARLGNVQRTELQCDLGEVLRVPISLESRRRYELGNGYPVAAAGAQTPASRQPGQAYTLACKLKWCKRKG
jgi:hypothetical protein